MEGMVLIVPTDLYNLLNQGTQHPSLSDTNYLLLLDARKKHEYNESHVICAKKAPKNDADDFAVPYDAELECKKHVIVYDGRTQSLKEDSPAIDCAKMLWKMGSRNPVKVLQGGYEGFSALYPFLRTQKILYMPREQDDINTYPIEIIPGVLYLGNWRQGNAAYIQKDLKIKAHVNCANEQGTFFKDEGEALMSIPINDCCESDIYSKFSTACQYINSHKEKREVVLVFSRLGISRSAAICMAYFMTAMQCDFKTAYKHVLKCSCNVRPNRGFIQQLAQYEEEIFHKKYTDISDPNF